MVIKFSIESGVNIAEIFGEVDTSDKQKALDMIGEKAKGLFLSLHPEMRPDGDKTKKIPEKAFYGELVK